MSEVLRTPDECFSGLPGFAFDSNYLTVEWPTTKPLRMHYLDEGPRDGRLMLLLHGEPSWSYLYRKMIPPLVAAGFRCVAPDLIGFGRSDKPAQLSDYTYAAHLAAVGQFVEQLRLHEIHLFCQDWGGLLGLRLVAQWPDRFAAVCASNTMLPTATSAPGEAFSKWREFSQTVPEFPAGGIIRGATVRALADGVEAAYDAPYPDERFKSGARQFPLLVPAEPDMPEAAANREAWKSLAAFDKPFLTLFSDSDPVTAGGDKVFQSKVSGCAGQPHAVIKDGGHFVQEDAGEELAEHLIAWLT